MCTMMPRTRSSSWSWAGSARSQRDSTSLSPRKLQMRQRPSQRLPWTTTIWMMIKQLASQHACHYSPSPPYRRGTGKGTAARCSTFSTRKSQEHFSEYHLSNKNRMKWKTSLQWDLPLRVFFWVLIVFYFIFVCKAKRKERKIWGCVFCFLFCFLFFLGFCMCFWEESCFLLIQAK